MTSSEALAFVRKHGVVLVSAKGPVPRLVDAIVDQPVKGSWWAHPQGRHIFRVLQTVTESDAVLQCRLVDDKITLVHRRLWPALVRLYPGLPRRRLARVQQVHTTSGRHANFEIAFPEWVPAEVKRRAAALSEDQARAALGPWGHAAGKRSARSKTKRARR
jgi:hypothetical protein